MNDVLNGKRRLRFSPLCWFWVLLPLVFWSGHVCGQSAAGTWDSRFTLPPGLNGPVNAVITWSNALYVGGWFSKAGGVPASNIAKWDGTNWTALGGGVSGQIYALAVDSTGLYAGGVFDTAGGISASNVAKWDGTNWKPMGTGVSIDSNDIMGTAVVFTLYSDGSNLFAGGQFDSVNGTLAYNVARWDGANWNAMDGGADLPDWPGPWGVVRAITGDGTNIYAGGIFIQAGSVAATNIARWDGNTWHATGDCTGGAPNFTYQANTLHGAVNALTMHQGVLMVGGNFDFAGGIPASGFATWDGTAWHNVGDVAGGTVNALESYGDSVYVAGAFNSMGGIAATNLAVWSNGVWAGESAVTSENGSIRSITHSKQQICIGGQFGLINGVSAGNVALWNGTNWSAPGQGIGNSFNQPISALATDGSNVFAAGTFDSAGTNASSGLAKWDGTNWSSVGTALPSFWVSQNALAVIGSNVYVGGSFLIPDLNSWVGLACWDGIKWMSPGGIVGGEATQLLAIGNTLYAFGYFSDATGNQFGPLSALNGTNWTKVPGYNGEYGYVESVLATDHTNLYFADNAFQEDGSYNTIVYMWDGANLVGFAELPGLRASSLAVCGTNIYLGGSMTTSNYAPVLYLFNGVAWQQMGALIPDTGHISCILPLRGNLYVGGTFASANGTPANSIVKWDGANWLPLREGLSYGFDGSTGSAFSMVALGRQIFVGGQFATAGTNDSGNFAIWNEAPDIRLFNPRSTTSGGMAFDIGGIKGDQLEIQASSSLTNWTHLSTVTLTNDNQSFCDSISTNINARFYRARFVK